MEDNYIIKCGFPAEYRIDCISHNDGIQCHKIIFSYQQESSKLEKRKIEIEFSFPAVDIYGQWHPACGFDRGLKADWFAELESMTSISAPVVCFFNAAGENRHTIALSEVKQRVRTQYGIHEEDGTMRCRIVMDLLRDSFADGYQIDIWHSSRIEPYWETIDQVRKWWEQAPGWKMMGVPVAARESMYSFWYSAHQNVTAQSVEKECSLAADMGFTSVIVDDGWQTDDGNRGYAFCGDWEPSTNKFPDMAEHVGNVHKMGLNYLLWFSIPYLGKKSAAWSRFHDKLLYFNEQQQAGILDLRYPEIRGYLKEIYCKAVRDWGIDGLKLDFIDEFYLRPDSPAFSEEMDFADIQEALDVFLADITKELKKIKPDILIEFRQKYIGPQIRKYGNFLRVVDCPGSALCNRIGTIDLRLLSGATAIHSDMMMWNEQECPEEAALQLLAGLFAVPQVSVSLERLSGEMKEMLGFWLGFMKEHMKLLQLSPVHPEEPENLYPEVSVENDREKVLIHYSKGRIVDLRKMPEALYYIHGTKKGEVCFSKNSEVKLNYRVLNCMGQQVEEGYWLEDNWNELVVPTAGMVQLIKKY